MKEAIFSNPSLERTSTK